jgi:hypothetical protein
MRPFKLIALAALLLTSLSLFSSREPATVDDGLLATQDLDALYFTRLSSYEDGEKLALRDLEQGLKQYVVFGLVIDGRQIEKHLASYGLEAYFAGCVVSDWGDGYNDTVRRELGIRERISTLIALEPAVDL